MDPFIGEIIMFAGNFPPRGWAFCDGQLLSINSHSALFSILGTTYGGDGRTTFGLPELRGRVPMHAGNGPGLTPRPLGQKSGQESVTLTQNQIPSHHHPVVDLPVTGTMKTSKMKKEPPGTSLTVDLYTTAALSADAALNGTLVTSGNTMNTGGSQEHNNIQPYQTVNFIIALEGTYPSRS